MFLRWTQPNAKRNTHSHAYAIMRKGTYVINIKTFPKMDSRGSRVTWHCGRPSAFGCCCSDQAQLPSANVECQTLSFISDNPRDTSLTARNLQINSYTFTVKANTTVGQCGATSITLTLNSLSMLLVGNWVRSAWKILMRRSRRSEHPSLLICAVFSSTS